MKKNCECRFAADGFSRPFFSGSGFARRWRTYLGIYVGDVVRLSKMVRWTSFTMIVNKRANVNAHSSNLYFSAGTTVFSNPAIDCLIKLSESCSKGMSVCLFTTHSKPSKLLSTTCSKFVHTCTSCCPQSVKARICTSCCAQTTYLLSPTRPKLVKFLR